MVPMRHDSETLQTALVWPRAIQFNFLGRNARPNASNAVLTERDQRGFRAVVSTPESEESAMIKRETVVTWLVVLGAAFGLVGNSAQAQNHEGSRSADPKDMKKAVELPNCPVMDEPVDFSVKTMTPEGPMYFCCKSCIKKFEADPAKYAKQTAEQRKILAKLPKTQVACPVSGKPVDEKSFVETDGKKTFFCCKGCVAKYQKEPGRYAARLADCYSYQTKCPVMNEEIDPQSSITLKTGQTIYFCCDGCDKKFLKDPAKYVSKLEAQGTHIDPKNVEIASAPATDHDGHDKGSSHAGHDQGHEGHDH